MRIPRVKLDAFPSGSDARESVVDVPLGAIDALEVFCSQEEAAMRLWYHFLNCGFPLGISGGSDAFLNQSFAFVAGGDRVYVQTRTAIFTLGLDRWLAPRPCVCDRRAPVVLRGAESAARRAIELRSWSGSVFRFLFARISIIPMSRLEIVANGRVLQVARGGPDVA